MNSPEPAWPEERWRPLNIAWTRADSIGLAAVLALALAVRLLYFFSLRQQPWYGHPILDDYVYHLWAQSLAAGDWLGREIFNQSPLYPYGLGVLYSLVGPRPGAAIFLQLLVSAVNCGLLVLLGRRLLSRPAGFLAGGLAAVYAPGFFLAGSLLTATLIETLNLCALLACLWAWEKRSWQAWCLPGALFGLSLITRPNVVLLLLGVAWWLWHVSRTDPAARRRALLALAVGAALAVAPVTLRNSVVLKEFILTVPTGALNFFLGNAPHAHSQVLAPGEVGMTPTQFASEFKRSAERRLGRALTFSQSNRYWLGLAWAEIGRAPGEWLKTLLRKTGAFFNAYEDATSLDFTLARQKIGLLRSPWLQAGGLWPLALLGGVLCWPQRRRLFLVYVWAAAYAASNILLFVTMEYRYAAVPALLLLAAGGGVKLVEYLRQRRWRRLAAAAVAGGLLAWLVNLPGKSRAEQNYLLACAHGNIAGMYERMGNLAGALEEYAAAKALVTPASQLEFYAAIVFKEMQARSLTRGPQPLAGIKELLPYIQNRPELLDKLGQFLDQSGYYDLSVAAYGRAARESPQTASYYLHLGQALLHNGQLQAAADAFNRALALAPELAPEIMPRQPPAQGPSGPR